VNRYTGGVEIPSTPWPAAHVTTSWAMSSSLRFVCFETNTSRANVSFGTAGVVGRDDQPGLLDHHPTAEWITERLGAGLRAGDADAAAPRLVKQPVGGQQLRIDHIKSPSKYALERDGTTA